MISLYCIDLKLTIIYNQIESNAKSVQRDTNNSLLLDYSFTSLNCHESIIETFLKVLFRGYTEI